MVAQRLLPARLLAAFAAVILGACGPSEGLADLDGVPPDSATEFPPGPPDELGASAREAAATSTAEQGVTVPDARLPGGRPTYSVALAKLSRNTNTDWVKVGTYAFRPDGTVEATLWSWSQAAPVRRTTTAVRSRAASCSAVTSCGVDIPGGFDGPPNDRRMGHFRLVGAGDEVEVRWSAQWVERWRVEPTATYARLRFVSGFNTNRGFGYGSVQPAHHRVQMASVQREAGMTYEYWSRHYDADSGKVLITGGVPSFSWRVYGACTDLSYELTYAQPASAQRCANGSSDSAINNYVYRVNSADRRDAWWQWHTCLADRRGGWDACYGCSSSQSNGRLHGGSHVKALIQAVDDRGAYLGHVGVEASFAEGSCGSPGASRVGDMLGILRFGPERGHLGPSNPL